MVNTKPFRASNRTRTAILTAFLFALVGCAPQDPIPAPPGGVERNDTEGMPLSVPVPAPLEEVERDQVGETRSPHDTFNRNIALDTMRSYTHVSSYRRGAFGHLAHDGKADTHWIIDPEQVGTLQISWGLAVPVNRIEVTEKNSGSISSLTLEIYTGKKWETMEPVDAEQRNLFIFESTPASALRISIKTGADAAGITEVSVYDTEQAAPLPRYGSAALLEAMRNSDVEGEYRESADAVVTPTLNPQGITYAWAGFRASANPDTNSAAWYKYSETKSIRSWFNASRNLSRYVNPPETVTTPEQFEVYKRQIRDNPEGNDIIDTKGFMQRFHEELFAEFSVYNRLGIEVINQTGPKDWPDTLQDDLIQWAATYAATYYLAKNYGVAAHQYGNEPDSYFNKSTEEQIARRLTLAADAVHAAIEDVNRYANRDLKAVFAAPVLASDFQGRTARIMMRNLYTRYDGSQSATPLFQLFNRHRYGNRPHQNALEVRQAKQMMQEEAGEVLPQVFTELNYSTGGNWARPGTTFTNDTPAVFTSIASIWGWMMQEQGVHGIFIFKLDDTTVWSRPGVGPFSNVVTYSMFPEQDTDAEPKTPQQISYGTKNFEVSRLFGRGFHGSRPLLQTDVACSDLEYRSWTTLDEDAGRFYIWSVQANDFESYELEFDLSKLDLPPGALITAETVSEARHGEVTHVMTLPEDRKIRIRQAPQSAMLLTVHQRPLAQETLYPAADAMVMQGEHSQRNFGGETRLEVGRHSNPDQNKISFLRFDLSEAQSPVQRAVLELHGQSVSANAYDGGFLFRVYALQGDAWSEQTITAENAPNVYRTVSAMKEIDLENYPVGHVTAFNTPSSLRVDVTGAVEEARKENRSSLTLVLIREIHWPEELTDASSAVLSSREAGRELSPKLHLWY